MNAQGVKDDAHLNRLLDDDNYIVQEKLDGMRAVVHITPKGLRIFSRGAGVADPTKPLEKTSSLPHLAEIHCDSLVGTILDCEVLSPGVDAAQLSGNIHANEVRDDNRLVKLFVFDILRFCSTDLCEKPLSHRLEWLKFVKGKMQSSHLVFLPYAESKLEKRMLRRDVLARGGEGIMLKRLDALYVLGGRPSNNWYKAKKSASFDCVVLGFSKGQGKYNNHIGAVVFGQYVKGSLIELGQASGMKDSEREDMSRHPAKYIGKVVTIKGMERLKSGAIRHPVYAGIRHDKSPEQCRWYQGEQ
jgi:ATP-dependent DNA ligase